MNVTSQCNAAALDGITTLLAGGSFVLLGGSGNVELATLPFQTSGGAFGAATNASPAVATSTAIGTDDTPTAGTIDAFELRTAANSLRIGGTVDTSGADLNLTDNVIPADATEVSCPAGLQLSLLIS